METVLASALLAFPGGLRVAEPAEEPGGLPKRLERASRVPERHGLRYDDTPIMLEPETTPELAESFPQHDLAVLRLLVRAHDFGDGFNAAQPLVEAMIDALAFQMQTALHVVGFNMLDITEPLAVGENRDVHNYAGAESTIAPKFSGLPPDFTWHEFAVDVPHLVTSRLPSTTPDRMALWWYIKGLDVPYAVDKFMCFWTAVEILWDQSNVRVSQPYNPPCGHVLTVCPQCSSPMTRIVRGASIKQFLREEGAMPDDSAAEVWKLRQVVHGRNLFSADRLPVLGRMVTELRSALLFLLKRQMHIPEEEPPAMARATGPILDQLFVAIGHRAIDENDIDVIAFLSAL